MPRFVVLHHEMPPGYSRPSHYDLMFEQGESLRTWALPSLPEHGQEIAAEELVPHRLAYLDYEGEVSAGRGQVTRIAGGEYAMLEETANRVRVKLAGQCLAGELTLLRSAEEPRQWRIRLS